MSTATNHDRHTHAMTTEQPDLLEKTLTATDRQQSIRAEAARFLGVPPDKVCGLLRNVWRTSNGEQELTDNEMFAGMSMIARYGLDPIAKEVYVTRSKGRLMTIIGIDGFVKILDRTEGYDGFEQELGWSENGKDLEWVETKIYSTLRSKPAVYRAFSIEYARICGMVAKSLPWHMLRLFSLHHATRLFTPLGAAVMTDQEARFAERYDPSIPNTGEAENAERKTAAKALTDRLKRAQEAAQREEAQTIDPPTETPQETAQEAEDDIPPEAIMEEWQAAIDQAAAGKGAGTKLRLLRETLDGVTIPEDVRHQVSAQIAAALSKVRTGNG